MTSRAGYFHSPSTARLCLKWQHSTALGDRL